MSEEIKLNSQDILDALLNTEDVPTKYVPMPRFKDKDGNPIYFKVKGLDSKTVTQIKQRCEYPVRRKGGQVDKQLDVDKFNASLIVEGCIEPNWSDERLLKKYNTHDPVEVIQRRLLAGEMATLGEAILELSGFYDDINEVKN